MNSCETSGKTMKSRLTFTLLLALLSSANSTQATGMWVDISDFHLWSNTYENDIIRIQVPSGYQNPSSCSEPDSYMVLTTLSEYSKQRIYSTLLAAKMANRPVRLWVDGCLNDRPTVQNVILRD
jgi:hypothetical protein